MKLSLQILTVMLCSPFASAAHFAVNSTKAVAKIDPEFISANLDFELINASPGTPRWKTFDYKSPKVRSLLHGLAPCYLRFGGSGADWTVFSDDTHRLYYQPTNIKLHVMHKEDVDKLVNLTRATGTRLLFDFNLNVRYYDDWDPTNAERLLSYMASKGYGENLDFELGNEPDEPPMMKHTGKQLGRDYLSFVKLIRSFPNFKYSNIVGADIVSTAGLSTLMPDFLSIAGENISATTFHQYYFNGFHAPPSEYINPKHFDGVKRNIELMKELVKKHSPNKDLRVWFGETADAWHGGTENVTDRYISGFLWLDKLGLAAQHGVSTIMRQTFYGGFYGLIDKDLNPNPDYWLSYIHKTLVGRNVFSTNVIEDLPNGNYKKSQFKEKSKYNTIVDEAETALIRMYSHCTKKSDRYPVGALTVFGINLKNVSEIVTFDPELASQPVDQYLLLPADNGLLSKSVMLNGQVLHLLDNKPPKLIPVSLPNVVNGIRFPQQSFGFWVFPKISISQCI